MYFGDSNVDGMLATLQPLHAMLDKGPETLREVSINEGKQEGEKLIKINRSRLSRRSAVISRRPWIGARSTCAPRLSLTYIKPGTFTRQVLISPPPSLPRLSIPLLTFSAVYRRIKKQLPQITTLELQYVSPKLLSARDFELAVPGTYRAGEPIVRIASFAPTLSVFNSKQRPRKLTIHGSDGVEYVFLLKGLLLPLPLSPPSPPPLPLLSPPALPSLSPLPLSPSCFSCFPSPLAHVFFLSQVMRI